MKLNFKYSGFSVDELATKENQKLINDIHKKIFSDDKSAGTTWATWPKNYDKKELAKILKLAKEIETTSDVLLVIGIGGSYLGAKAGLDFLPNTGKIKVIFVGTNFDYSDLSKTLESIKDKNVTVNVISKSGTTVEILSALNIVEKFMKNKYKNGYKSRLIFTTDKNKGYLRQRANSEGIETLSVPDYMGGRFSVLSAVGLLPFACAGINIKKLLEGALAAENEFENSDIKSNIAYQYAVYRYLVEKKYNKKIELFASFNSCFSSIGLWLQQLFAESHGKDKKGMFVCFQSFSTDLHSVGQYLQQGQPLFAETFLKIKNQAKDAQLTNIALDSPIKFLEGTNYTVLNNCALEGTIKAHNDANMPIVTIEIENSDEFNLGYLFYFFELACSASGYLIGVNPFNQPGVEQYKSYMKELLNNK